jgi:putative hemolysin
MPSSEVLAGRIQGSSPGQDPDLFPFANMVQKLLPMERIRELYRRAQQPVNRSILENVLTEMKVTAEVSDSDLRRIPSTGALVVTANHPFGLLDGAVLGAILLGVREDVKIVTNSLFASIPELHECCIFADPWRKPESAAINRRAARQSLAWLHSGGALAVFPAGEVAQFDFRQMEVIDPEWNPMAAHLARLTGASALPVYFSGHNSVPFQVLARLHPGLRIAFLLHEFLQQKGKRVEVRIGAPVQAEFLRQPHSHREAAGYLRWRTYLLAQRATRTQTAVASFKLRWPSQKSAAVMAAIPQHMLIQDLSQLAPHKKLHEDRDFCVYLADACEIPHLMREVGRLREITFRTAGEGTGKRCDLDRFDHYYKHLLLWSKSKQELAGAYRMGATPDILPQFGVDGLYTSDLFRYDPRFFNRIGPALELGRSFVRLDYQRQYAPLLALWKGIGHFLVSRPELAVLFGAVSISSRYNRMSREMIVRFFQSREANKELATLAAPRRPFRQRWKLAYVASASCENFLELNDLVDPIADVELDGKDLPILLKHYAKLGGRVLSFNVDQNFSNVLDGLVLVDLRKTKPALLTRYMGSDGIRTFQRYHGMSCGPVLA